MSILDEILSGMNSDAAAADDIINENHKLQSINWVNGLSDPGEMIACGYMPELRRREGEQDQEYAARITPIVLTLPPDQQDRIMRSAINRAGFAEVNGRISVWTVGKSWHGLGVSTQGAKNSREAMELAGLNYRVEKTPLQYDWEGLIMEAPGRYGLVRKDNGTFFAECSKVYKVIQSADGFKMMDDALAAEGALYDSAGALGKGEKYWLAAYLPKQSFTLRGGDEVQSYGVFMNSHIPGESAKCFPTTVRVQCQNTLNTASRLAAGKALAIRHAGDVQGKLRAVQETLGVAVKSLDNFREGAEAMSRTTLPSMRVYANGVLDSILSVTEAQMTVSSDVLAATLAATESGLELTAKQIDRQKEQRGEILSAILNNYESDEAGGAVARGTVWGGLNAITRYADHSELVRYRGTPQQRASRRFESILSGAADEVKQTAYAAALEYVR